MSASRPAASNPAPAASAAREGSPAPCAAAARALPGDKDHCRPAWRDAASHGRVWTIVVLGLALDLWSKQWAFETMGQNGRIPLVPYVLEFQTMLNAGALFGMGRGLTSLFLVASLGALLLVGWMFVQSSSRRWALHVALGGIVAGALGNMYDRWTVRLSEVGGAGRTVLMARVASTSEGVLLEEFPPGRAENRRVVRAPDRVGPEAGYVRDFIKIPTHLPAWLSRLIFGRPDQELWPWVFNVADMLLVGGVGILAIQLWRDGGARQPSKAPHEEGDSP